MRIITLNTWGGKAGKGQLLAFFEKYKDLTDVFCLQEVWSAPYVDQSNATAAGQDLFDPRVMTNGMQDIAQALSGHRSYFRPQFTEHYGLMMLVKKDLTVVEEGECFVYKQRGYVSDIDVADHARNIQYVTLKAADGPLTVINLHALWNGKGKTDSHDRLLQSQNILDFMKTLKGNCVLAGDFNLLPDTQSIKMLEDAGLKNLVKEFGVTSTRTSFYTKPEKFADYIFVTPDIKVKNFSVLPEEVSDHAALQVEF